MLLLSLSRSTAKAGQEEHSVDSIFTTITNVLEVTTGGEITSCTHREKNVHVVTSKFVTNQVLNVR